MFHYFKIIKSVLFLDRTSKKFVVGVILGLGFSMAVILSTIGIMDGFISKLKSVLRESSGDIIVQGRSGFYFKIDEGISDSLKAQKIINFSPVIKSQGFAMNDKLSKGVLVKGVERSSFKKVTGVDVNLTDKGVALGEELAFSLRVKVGGEIILGLANGNSSMSSMPLLKLFKVEQIIKHGIYQKDARTLYMNLNMLSGMQGIKGRYNHLALKIPSVINNEDNNSEQYLSRIMDYVTLLGNELGDDFYVYPFWLEERTTIEAVETEKFMIGIILQLVVVISIFNVLAFIIFINEKRTKEFFLFKALGMGNHDLVKMWYTLIFGFWGISAVISIIFTSMFDIFLQNFSLFQELSDIYKLNTTMSLALDISDYLLVFMLTLVWLCIISWFVLKRISKQTILQGLRKEFG